MRNFIYGMLAMAAVGALIFLSFLLGRRSTDTSFPSVISPAQTPVVSQITSSPVKPTSIVLSPSLQKPDDNDLIKAALFKKNNWKESDDITVTVSTNDSTYASGTATSKGSGGYFFAKKVDGNWVIVADGNGVILCSALSPYPDYPNTLISECYDDVLNKSLKR